MAAPELREAPVVPGLPLLGSFFEVRDDAFGFLERCQREQGRVFVVRLGGQSLYVVWHPDDLKPVLMDTGKVFGRADGTPMERIVGKSILVAEGERWRRLRVISREAFRTKATAPLTDMLAGPLGELVARLAQAGEAGEPVDLEAECARCFFDFTCAAIFGTGLVDEGGEFTAAVGALLDEARLDAAIEEAMRLYPAAYAMPRQASQEAELGGVRMPAGAAVIVMFYLTHRDPVQWEDPAAFRPARFLGEQDRHPHAYLPFGLGPHRCLGKDLAMRMLRATTRRVLDAFDLSPAGPMPGGEPRITLRPKGPALAKVRRR